MNGKIDLIKISKERIEKLNAEREKQVEQIRKEADEVATRIAKAIIRALEKNEYAVNEDTDCEGNCQYLLYLTLHLYDLDIPKAVMDSSEHDMDRYFIALEAPICYHLRESVSELSYMEVEVSKLADDLNLILHTKSKKGEVGE